VDWSYHEHTDAALAMLSSSYDDIRLISVEQAERSLSPHLVLDQLDWNVDTVFVVVLGNEVNGVNQAVIDRSDVVAEIPQSGTKHSLNVTVAAGVVLWEMYKGLEL
jgi:tRNA G18 (ribose-2'-O)-methylase SpoU